MLIDNFIYLYPNLLVLNINMSETLAKLNDLEIKEALIFANKVAGISTTKLGAAASMPFSEEIVDK